MTKYRFYYDESEHSRKINYKTITADNYYDNFIVVVIGWRSENEADLFGRYISFEEKYNHRQSNGELKSSSIKQSQFENGFASLSNDNINLLEDFFELFDENILVYYAVVSKIEYIVRQLFENYKNSLFVDMDAIKYSIVKALVVYQPIDIIKGLYENSSELISLLKQFFEHRIEKNKANELLKEKENEQFRQILMLLDDVSTIKAIDWNYDISFIGFEKYLVEKKIDSYSLTIDMEGENSNTKTAAERIGLSMVKEADSLHSCGIRMADMLAGIISKLLKSLSNALRYNLDEEQISKKLLTNNWFLINDRQLALYKKLHNVAVELNKAGYKAFAGTYSDNLIVLISFLGFMNQFDSASDIKKDICLQGEYFNTYACKNLEEYFKQMRDKLPIDHVDDTSKDFFKNRRGAEVYFDTHRQPLFVIKDDNLICEVLSVGFNKDMIPLITIMEADGAKCYRLPADLIAWTTTLVGYTSMGAEIFPSKVAFSKINGKYYADIL